MCGIVGIINDNQLGANIKELSIFRQLLITDSVRGSHGTGILGIDVDGTADYRKLGNDPFALLRSKVEGEKETTEEWALGNTTTWRALIGHNRFATTGGISTESSHPFKESNYSLVHNGTLNASSDYDIKKFPVDSHSMCARMAEVGIHQTIKETSGAIATAVYDENLQEIYLYRNEDRPLFFAWDKFMKKIIFGSELGMLQWICGRESWGNMKFAPLPIHTLLIIPIDDISKMREETLRPKFASWTGRGVSDDDFGFSSRSVGHPVNTGPEYWKKWDEEQAKRREDWKKNYGQPFDHRQQQQQLPSPGRQLSALEIAEWNKKLDTINAKAKEGDKVQEGKLILEGEVEAKDDGKETESGNKVVPITKGEKLKRGAPKSSNKGPASGNDYIATQVINGIRQDQSIVFSLHDYQEIINGPNNVSWCLEGSSEDSPMLIIKFYVNDEDQMLTLFNESAYLRGKVRKLLYCTKNDREPNRPYDIAWVQDVEVVSGKQDDSHLGSVH